RERELPGDREPEPRAAAVARPERPEDAVALVRPDAGARVVDREGHIPVLRRQLDPDPAALRRPAERVREEIGDDLEDAVAVGDDHGAGTDLAAVVDRAPARLLAERRERTLGQLLHVDF